MCVESKKERHEKMMSVPEGFEGLASDINMGCSVNKQHTEKHDVASDATCFSVMDLNGSLWSDLSKFDIEEAGVLD